MIRIRRNHKGVKILPWSFVTYAYDISVNLTEIFGDELAMARDERSIDRHLDVAKYMRLEAEKLPLARSRGQ